MRVAAALLSTLLFAGVPGPSNAQPAALDGSGDEPRISMRFLRTDLRQILLRVGPMLGERILFDSSVAGRVTISVTRPVTQAEAWDLLHAALALKGFVAAPAASGGFKIIPMPETSAGDPWTLGKPITDSEARIVTLLTLRNLPVAELREILLPLLDPQTLAIPTTTGNSLIVATTQRRLGAIVRLARELDVRPLRELEIVTLHERDAAAAARLLETRYDQLRGGRPIVEVWVDDRTNTVLYRAPDAMLPDVRELIDQFDQPIEGTGEIHVIPLRYASPDDIVSHLQELSRAQTGAGPTRQTGLAGVDLNVVAEPTTSSLIVTAGSETMQRVRAVVRELDRPPRQVAVDALVFEWNYGEDDNFRVVGSRDFETKAGLVGTVEMLPSALVDPQNPAADGLTVSVARGLSALNVVAEARSTKAQLLMQPHLIALSGEEQLVFSGNEIPIESATPQATTANFVQSRTFERRDVGIQLRVRPTVGRDYATQLEVDLKLDSVSAALFTDAQGPILAQREIHTIAQLQPGAALVIGSFTKPYTTTSRVGIPFLMNIPILGQWLSQTDKTTSRAHIVVGIQVRPLPDSRARIANSIRRRVALERLLARENALPESTGGHYALRVVSELEETRADSLALQLDSELHPAVVLRWTPGQDESPVYDVQLLGFDSYEAAAEEAARLYAEGFDPDVLALASATDLLD